MRKNTAVKKKSFAVVVGLPVRNEERSLLSALESIRIAMLACNEPGMKLVVCINGCTDRSQEIAETFQKKYSDINTDVITSQEGLVRAQGEIVRLYPASIYMFPDADNIIEEKSLFYLLSELKENKKTVVAYAKTIPIKEPKNKSLFHTIGFLYESQTMLSKRHYFHGRLFATREWLFPSNEEILQRARKTHRNELLLKYCKGDILLSADDIYLSSYIMHTYGLDAIVQVHDAHCYSNPVGSFFDWYNVYRRRNIEMEKMYRWFPEWNYLKPYLNRRTDWKKWFKAPVINKILWILYLAMRGIFWIALKIELLFLYFSIFQPSAQWRVTDTTKKEIRCKNIFFIDVDGTLVDETGELSHHEALKETIHMYKQIGALFGLNTNRPWIEARKIYEKLGLNGPIVAEDGSYYKLSADEPAICTDDSIKDFCDIIEESVSDFKKSCTDINFIILRSTDKSFLSDASCEGMLFISGHREYTASIYVRKRGVADADYAERLAAHLKKSLATKTMCGARLAVVPLAGKITISPNCVDRLSTMALVCRKYYSEFDCIMISDQEDVGALEGRKYQCAAVGNALQSFKDAADYVSPKSFAEGVEDVIIHYND